MIIELNNAEAMQVAGALTRDELERMFPDGEWIGSSFFPNGLPKIPNEIPVEW
jgi:hypothetical protein